jgi:hypothetical protein
MTTLLFTVTFLLLAIALVVSVLRFFLLPKPQINGSYCQTCGYKRRYRSTWGWDGGDFYPHTCISRSTPDRGPGSPSQ